MLNERKLTPEEVKKRQEIIQGMLDNRDSLVRKYGPEAEKIMYGRATRVVKDKNGMNKIKKGKIRELIKTQLQEGISPSNLKSRIQTLIPQALKNVQKSEDSAIEYDALTKFPELKKIIVNLLTSDYDTFLASIDWVSPRPTTFRVNLKNDQHFYLIFNNRSWTAQIEGKKYYLLNLPEEEHAAQSIARLLRYGEKEAEPEEDEGFESDSGSDDFDSGGDDLPSDDEVEEI